MRDGYAQSTYHRRPVAWLERGPHPIWLQKATNVDASGHARLQRQQRTRRQAGLQARVRSLRSQLALLCAAVVGTGTPSLSVEQSPASR